MSFRSFAFPCIIHWGVSAPFAPPSRSFYRFYRFRVSTLHIALKETKISTRMRSASALKITNWGTITIFWFITVVKQGGGRWQVHRVPPTYYWYEQWKKWFVICYLCLPRDVTYSIGAVFSKWSCYSEALALAAPLASIVPGPTAFYSTPVPAGILTMAGWHHSN